MNTGSALIDVHERKITLRVDDESIEFLISNLMKHPLEDDMCMKVDVTDACVKEVSCQIEANRKI